MGQSMASQARDLLLSDRRRMVELFQSSDLGQESIEEFTALKPNTAEFANIGRLDEVGTSRTLIDLGLKQCFDTLLPSLVNDAGLNEIELVAVDSEQASATTRPFADGSQLVMVSDAMMSLIGHLGELLAVWGRAKGRNRYVSAFRREREFGRRDELGPNDPIVLGGAAALRFYIQQQRVFALAAKIGPMMSRRHVLRNVDAGLSAVAVQFVVAHEIGHVMLGHTAEPAGADIVRQHQREFEADEFGFDIISHATGSPGLAAEAALIGLSAIAVSAEPVFVRPPESHPPVVDRLANILSRAQQSRSAVNRHWGLVEMVSRAINTATSLPQECWEHMLTHRTFDTRHHSPQYFNVIRNYDISIDFTPKRTWSEIETLRDSAIAEGIVHYERFDFHAIKAGLIHLERGEPGAAVSAWGMASPAKILDASLPLSHHALVSAVTAAAALSHSSDNTPPSVRIAAVYLANQIAPHLARGEQTACNTPN